MMININQKLHILFGITPAKVSFIKGWTNKWKQFNIFWLQFIENIVIEWLLEFTLPQIMFGGESCNSK